MTHRRGCEKPPASSTPSRSVPGLVIVRCPTCGAVELRRTP